MKFGSYNCKTCYSSAKTRYITLKAHGKTAWIRTKDSPRVMLERVPCLLATVLYKRSPDRIFGC